MGGNSAETFAPNLITDRYFWIFLGNWKEDIENVVDERYHIAQSNCPLDWPSTAIPFYRKR